MSNDYQVLITSTSSDAAVASKRRQIYLRPFIVFYLSSLLTESVLLLLSVLIFSGFRDIVHKILWTLLFCPLGMAGAMASLVNCFITDKFYGSQAVRFVAILSLLVFGACNDLCWQLDHYFDYFGGKDYPWYFHGRYPLIFLGGWESGKMLFTDDGQKRLARFGI